jgi:hypothetical protein
MVIIMKPLNWFNVNSQFGKACRAHHHFGYYHIYLIDSGWVVSSSITRIKEQFGNLDEAKAFCEEDLRDRIINSIL